MGVLFKKPAFLLADKLDYFWRTYEGEAMTDCRERYLTRSSTSAAESKETENECRIMENFKRDHQGVRIPDYDAKDYPFYHQYFFYYQDPNEGDDTVSQKAEDTKPSATDKPILKNGV
jgi:hypothetical protein